MRMPVVSGKEVIAVIKKLGFEFKRQKGSHAHFVKETQGKPFHVTVPVHPGKKLNHSVFHSIARQAGYLPKEFAEFFR